MVHANCTMQFPSITPIYSGQTPPAPPEPLSDTEIQLIHAGLAIPNPEAIHSMAREIRKWRGEPNPDAV